MKKHYRKENDCLNCGTILEGKFCHNCGQENLQMKESFGHMMNHAISDYFHFDDQFFSTIKPLHFKPGFLSIEYLEGRRIRYLHPVKMYIFISLVYFVLLFQTGFKTKQDTPDNKKSAKKQLETSSKQLDSLSKAPYMPAYAKADLSLAKKNTDAALANGDTIDDDNGVVAKPKGYRIPGTTHDTTYTQYLANQQKLAPNERDGFITRLINKKALSYRQNYGSRAKEVFLEQFEHNIPKMMFLMLPLCALIFKITFWRNKKYYVEHLIYTFHLHCFLFLFLIIIMLLEIIIPTGWHIKDWLDLIATVCIIWYLYKSLRVFYRRSPIRTVTKLLGATFMYFFVFMFCLVLVFAVTAITL
jgi:hypothetical protein